VKGSLAVLTESKITVRRTLLVTEEQLDFIKKAVLRRQMLMSQVLLTDQERHYSSGEMLKDLLVRIAYAEGNRQ
jgi:hypothetical protein